MKKVSKMFAMLLTLVLVLSVSGCGGSGESGKQLIGTWALQYNLADLLAGEMEGFEDFNAPLEMSICFEFTEDGKFTMFGEEESFKANFATWVDDFVTFGTDIMYQEFENTYSLTKEEADAQFVEANGMGISDYLRAEFMASVDVDALLQEMTITGTYETSGNKLYMAQDGESIDKNAYDVFTVDGNNLKLELPSGVDASEGEILPGLSYPLEFTKKN